MFIILLFFDRPIQRATATTDRGHQAPAMDMLCMCLIWVPRFLGPQKNRHGQTSTGAARTHSQAPVYCTLQQAHT